MGSFFKSKHKKFLDLFFLVAVSALDGALDGAYCPFT